MDGTDYENKFNRYENCTDSAVCCTLLRNLYVSAD